MRSGWLLVLALVGCERQPAALFTPAQVAPAWRSHALDLLFQIDDSAAVCEAQQALASTFYRLLEYLDSTEGGRPDLHIGVVSSSVSLGHTEITGCDEGDGGRLQHGPGIAGCLPPDGAFIIDRPCAAGAPPDCRTRNYDGGLADTFACIASIGCRGCGFEQPLESIRLALDPVEAPPENAGFLRADAHLAVVMLMDEDDCSAADLGVFDVSDAVLPELGPISSFRCTEFGLVCDGAPPAREPASYGSCEPREGSYLRHPREYLEHLRSLKTDPAQLSVAAIIGDPGPVEVQLDSWGDPALMPSCCGTVGCAAPGVRLAWLVEQLGDRGLLTSVCDAGDDAYVRAVGPWLARILDAPLCLEGQVASADLNPAAPGLQLDCQVADVTGMGTAGESWTRLPPCAMQDDATPAPGAQRPCWHVALDDERCPATPTRLRLRVARDTPAAAGAQVAVSCEGQ